MEGRYSFRQLGLSPNTNIPKMTTSVADPSTYYCTFLRCVCGFCTRDEIGRLRCDPECGLCYNRRRRRFGDTPNPPLPYNPGELRPDVLVGELRKGDYGYPVKDSEGSGHAGFTRAETQSWAPVGSIAIRK